MLLEGHLKSSEWPIIMHYDVTYYCTLQKSKKLYSIEKCRVDLILTSRFFSKTPSTY